MCAAFVKYCLYCFERNVKNQDVDPVGLPAASLLLGLSLVLPSRTKFRMLIIYVFREIFHPIFVKIHEFVVLGFSLFLFSEPTYG